MNLFIFQAPSQPRQATSASVELLCRDTSQKFGIWGFCQNFLQKYCDSLKRDSIFWQGSPTVLRNYHQIECLGVLWMAQITKFGYSGDPNNRITK
jgi:hypothetical protein